MSYILKAAEMRAADKYAAETIGIDSYELMVNAANSLFSEAETMVDFCKEKNILIFCGKGNNGGDGFVAAEFLYKKGYNVKVIILFGRDLKTMQKKHTKIVLKK